MNRRLFLEQLGWMGAAAMVGGPAFVDTATSRPSSRPSSRLSPLLEVKPREVRFRIAILTDPHLALRDKSLDFKVLRYSPYIVQQHLLRLQQLGRITGRKVDLLLIPGDMSRDSEPWNHQALLKMIRPLPFPTLVVPGNHDVRKHWMPKTNWGVEKVVQAYKGRLGGYQSKQPYYAQEVTSGLVVVGLNSSDTPDGALRGTWNGRVDDAQVQWFANTLKKHAGKKTMLVMVHHNLIPHHAAEKETSKSNWKNFHTDNGDALVKLMARYNTNLVITGHHHINRITKHDSLPVSEIVTSGACSYPSSIRILDIGKDGRQLDIHTLDQSWTGMRQHVLKAAQADSFWKLPDKPKDAAAMIRFLEGRPQDRRARLLLPKTREFS